MLSLLTRKKSFRDPWVGHPALNRRWQLHRHRVQLAEMLCLWRRLLRPAQLASLERDGFVVLENFLPQPEFDALRDEVEAVVARASRLYPAPDNTRPGFRPKHPSLGDLTASMEEPSTAFFTSTPSRCLGLLPSPMTSGSVRDRARSLACL